MRTLEDSKKPKSAPKKPQQQEGQKNKPQQVKTVKTSFYEPFTYRLECVSHQDSVATRRLVVDYLKELRKYQPEDKQLVFHRNALKKIISMKASNEQVRSALKSQYCVVGIHCILKKMLLGKMPSIVVIYFNPKNYELYEELLATLQVLHGKYILIKNNEDKAEVVKQLSIKQLNAIALYQKQGFEALFAELERLSLRCFLQIPSVFQQSLQPAVLEQLTVTKEKA